MGSHAADIVLLGLLLTSGLGAGLLASRYGLPRVAAYVLAGVLFSEKLLGGPLGLTVGSWGATFTNAALGVIAYVIGGSITAAQIRRMGKVIVGAAVGESLGAAVVVFLAILLLAPRIAGVAPLQAALAFGALAVSTAPAATIAVIHQYRGRGPLTTTLLGVVAMDDAFGVILFSLMLAASVGGSLAGTLGGAVLSIAGAIALGLFAGRALALAGPRIPRVVLRLPLALGAILLIVGLAEHWGLAALLAAMATGFFARHFSRAAGDRLLQPIELLEEAVLLTFFTVAGAHFDPAVFLGQFAVIAIYFVARIVGKILGAAAGARIARAPNSVVRCLGLGLVPQAGVAVGLALTLSRAPVFAEGGRTIVNVILGTTVLFELLGPLSTRLALLWAGELGTRRERERSSA